MPVLVFGLGKLQRGRKEEVTFAVPRRTGDGHSERPGKPPAFLNSQVSETRSGVYVAFLHRCSLPNETLWTKISMCFTTLCIQLFYVGERVRRAFHFCVSVKNRPAKGFAVS